MSKVKSFSFPDDWKCLDNLLDKMPRAMDASKTVKVAVEQMLEKVTNKPYVSLDSFGTKDTVVPDLHMDVKTFSKLLKSMDIVEVRNLQKLLGKKKTSVDDEVYKRTQ
jgi:hypothetical protein